MSEARMAHQMRLGTQKMQRKAQHPQGNYDHDEFQFGLVVGQNVVGDWIDSQSNSLNLYLDGSHNADGNDTFNPAYITHGVPYLSSYVPTGCAAPGSPAGPLSVPDAVARFPRTTLAAAAPQGATSISTVGSLPSGYLIEIGGGTAAEANTIAAVSGTGPYTLTLSTALVDPHPAGDAVTAPPRANAPMWTYVLTYPQTGSGPSQASFSIQNGDPGSSNNLDATFWNEITWSTGSTTSNVFGIYRAVNGGPYFSVVGGSGNITTGVLDSLSAAASAGATSVQTYYGNVQVGQGVTIGEGSTAENHYVTGVTGSAAPYTVALSAPLVNAQAVGAQFYTLAKFADTIASAYATELQPGPSVTAKGTVGSTSYWYAVSSLNQVGESEASVPSRITNGNATLSSTNYNSLGWNPTTGATSYRVYRSTDGVQFALIATTASTQVNDTGLPALQTAATLRTANDTGDTVLVYRGKGRKRSSRLVLGKQNGAASPSGISLGTFNSSSKRWVNGESSLWGGVGAPAAVVGQAGDYYFQSDGPQLFYKTASGWQSFAAPEPTLGAQINASISTTTTLTVIPFGDVYEDNGSGWDTATNLYAIQAAGLYLIAGLVEFNTTAPGVSELSIYYNGSPLQSAYQSPIANGTEAVSYMYQCKAGDTLGLYVSVTNVGALSAGSFQVTRLHG